ncbi:MAG: CotH kinase family protein [Marinilabiliaceae bacterium]|nr:CotH kinase family protein [Marinilabiliaceae bacterium]
MSLKIHIISIIALFYFVIDLKSQLSNVVISEVCAVNENVIADQSGDYGDWIELYNSGAVSVNLNGLYLSDSKVNLNRHLITSANLVIEPDSFLIIWADGDILQGDDHIGFKISEGETLYISGSNGVIDSVYIGTAKVDHSIGRTTYTHNTNWSYFIIPTPLKANNTESFVGYATDPVFDVPSGFFTNSVFVSLTAPVDQTIYYTTTNYDPIPDSSHTTGFVDSIEINSTTVVRARCYKTGFIPSNIISQIYFINTSYSMPVWAIITDPNNLYGPTGIYSNPWNEGSEWERFSQHKYFINSNLEHSANSGIRIQGGNSVGMSKKAFRLHFKDEYGFNRLNYPLFNNTNINSFKQIVFRSGYDDDITVYGTLLRDPLSSDLWRLTGNLASTSEWANLILNNSYWGIYNIRESVDEDFIEDHLGTNNFDMIRFQKTGPELKHGSMTDWEQLTAFINTSDFSSDDAYEKVCDLIDMDNYINLLAFIHCSQFRSWTWGASAYKSNNVGGKWRWTIWDTDRAYSILSWNGFSEYALTYNEKWANFMPQKFLKNDNFKNELINRTADFLNAWFKPQNSLRTLDSIKAIIEPDIANEKERWNPSANWESSVKSVKSFLSNRPQYVRNQILSYFSINNTHNITVEKQGEGKVILNYLTLNSFPWNGIYFETIPISLTAVPAPGYRFNGWSNGDSSLFIDDLLLVSDTTLTAFFVEDTNAEINIIITEIMYHEATNYPSDDWFEIYNAGDDINMSGWWISDGNPLNKFIIPDDTYLRKGEYLVIAENIFLFQSVNPSVHNVIGSFGDGETGFSFSNSGECIYLFKPDSSIMDYVCYSDYGLWPTLADGSGSSLQLSDPMADNNNPLNWNASPKILFTPGEENRIDNVSIVNSKIDQLVVYPNPAKETINIKFSINTYDLIYLVITNQSGTVMYQNYVSKANVDNIITINTNNFSGGLYVISLITSNSVITKKIIIQ